MIAVTNRLLSMASQCLSVYAEHMDQTEVTDRHITRIGRRALLIGLGLGLALGIIIGFIIGTQVADQVVLIPLDDGTKT